MVGYMYDIYGFLPKHWFANSAWMRTPQIQRHTHGSHLEDRLCDEPNRWIQSTIGVLKFEDGKERVVKEGEVGEEGVYLSGRRIERASTMFRPMLPACAPAWETQPTMTSSISEASIPVRSTTASKTDAPSAIGCHFESCKVGSGCGCECECESILLSGESSRHYTTILNH